MTSQAHIAMSSFQVKCLTCEMISLSRHTHLISLTLPYPTPKKILRNTPFTSFAESPPCFVSSFYTSKTHTDNIHCQYVHIMPASRCKIFTSLLKKGDASHHLITLNTVIYRTCSSYSYSAHLSVVPATISTRSELVVIRSATVRRDITRRVTRPACIRIHVVV